MNRANMFHSDRGRDKLHFADVGKENFAANSKLVLENIWCPKEGLRTLTPNHNSCFNENDNMEKDGKNDTSDLHDICILSWNINGIGDKLGETDIHKFLKEHYVIVLQILWRGNCTA